MTRDQRSPSTAKSALLASVGVVVLLIAVGIGQAEFPGGAAPPPPPKPVAAPAPIPPTQVAMNGVTLTSVAVDLPDQSPTYPNTVPNSDVVNNNCTACHSPSMALNQPRLSAAQWTSEVEKMRNTFKASVAEKDVPAIVKYLSTINASLASAPGGTLAKDGEKSTRESAASG